MATLTHPQMSEAELSKLHIACGSYDGTVFAMSYEHTGNDESGLSQLKAEFIDPEAHVSPVTALAVCGDTVASSSGDEAIQLFSVSQHHRMGCLELHTGTVRQLVFADARHLISAGEDSCIAVWRCVGSCEVTQSANKWQCIRQMRRHKAPIKAMALHPSKRLLFSVADSENDHTLRIWSLTRGRQSYAARLRSLNIEGASYLSILREGSLHLLLIIVAISTFHRLDIINLSQASQKPIFSAQFPNMSVPPVVFHVSENCICLLVPIGNLLRAYRCSLNRNKSEIIAESRLPGKRFKFLKVLSWSEREELIAAVTSDADGSYIRGYLLNIEEIKEKAEEGKAVPSLGLKPIFTYDVSGIRITKADASWTSSGTEALSEEVKQDMEMNKIGNKSEEESDDVSTVEDGEDTGNEHSSEEAMI